MHPLYLNVYSRCAVCLMVCPGCGQAWLLLFLCIQLMLIFFTISVGTETEGRCCSTGMD
ncbi:hypothetical protein Taro_033961 [Colocasia esculenta]|uniref:Uncharacterized protein n=1 Tax=Colocasia esculenta TaxID=4460 RepID=A0A843WE24_COLES|nr:hypothetical protein [Colocasia esculenta]